MKWGIVRIEAKGPMLYEAWLRDPNYAPLEFSDQAEAQRKAQEINKLDPKMNVSYFARRLP